MPPKIENPANVQLVPASEDLLQRIFARYKKVIIEKEFSKGLSGGRVFAVRPIRGDGAPELPTVVKLAPVSLIQQEWQAYQQHVLNRLPRISQVSARPILVREAGLGGLRYTMGGDGMFEVMSLHDYCRLPETSVDKIGAALNYLFRIMHNIWSFQSMCEDFHLRASYDVVLPVNLLVQPGAISGQPAHVISPTRFPSALPAPGETVRLDGFVVHKVNYDTQTMTLRSPHVSPAQPTYFMRCKLPLFEGAGEWGANAAVGAIDGYIVETRESRLKAEVLRAFDGRIDPSAPFVNLTAGVQLPNPLLALSSLIERRRQANLATIHGDFNLENILIEPETGAISLIDFADAREDHVLHDLLRLETEIITRLLPELMRKHGLPLAPTLVQLIWRMHLYTLQSTPAQGGMSYPALQKPWSMLEMIRRTVRTYFCDANDISEYYQGLVFYLLGALKFRNLSDAPEAPLPKQVAFYAATLVHYLLLNPAADPAQPPPPLRPLLDHTPASNTPAGVVYPAENGADAVRVDPIIMLATLPTEAIAPLGPLPAHTRMPYSHNALFVGRNEELRAIAAHLRHPDAIEDGVLPTVVITGLGGLGKTQLATEFVHRYGRFFAGGVHWLSLADGRAVPAEIAACGSAMALRPDFEELPLEERGRLVAAAWASPLPRLLVFDNCDDPELLAQWRPTQGGCRLLATSRRADWRNGPGVETIALDVLRRTESLRLLREHHPDADGPLLDAIAQEVGDLPLALHLAGSYLSRYRRALDAEHYLAQLRNSALLAHPSLQTGSLSPTGHAQNVGRTIAVSFNQLDRLEPVDALALEALAGAACLAPGEPIPLRLLALTLRPFLNASKTKAAADAGWVAVPNEVGAAIQRLTELGLVRREAGEHLRLHRLLVAFVQQTMVSEIAQARPSLELVLCEEAERLNAAGYPAVLLAWQAHLRTVANMAYDREDEPAARICEALSEHFRQVGDYARARYGLGRVVDIRRKVWGEENEITARSLAALGIIAQWQGDLTAARKFLEQALAIQEAWLGEHPDTTITLNYLGFVFQQQDEIATARYYHERAITARRRIFGDNHPSVAESLCNLAYLAFIQANFDTARAHLENALKIQKAVWGDEHIETARVLTNLGELLFAQGNFCDAKEVLGTALTIHQQLLGEEHPETARVIDDLGDLLQEQGDVSKAREQYERALKIFNARHGEAHARTKRVRSKLSLLQSPQMKS